MVSYDNLYLSRIIVRHPDGLKGTACKFAPLLQEGVIKKDVPMSFMGLKDAETVKLFANTYLVLRESYFN